ncbi:hypothetical protein WDV06_34610, partial [Streptomyces racemochromogenes]
MTMDSAPARHTGGQSGTGHPGGRAFASASPVAPPAVAPAAAPATTRRAVTAIHPPRGPRADRARPAVRPGRARRGRGAAPLLA